MYIILCWNNQSRQTLNFNGTVKEEKKLIANKTSELKLKSYHKASKRLTAKKESLVGQSFMCMSV